MRAAGDLASDRPIQGRSVGVLRPPLRNRQLLKGVTIARERFLPLLCKVAGRVHRQRSFGLDRRFIGVPGANVEATSVITRAFQHAPTRADKSPADFDE